MKPKRLPSRKSFRHWLERESWTDVQKRIASVTERDVERLLSQPPPYSSMRAMEILLSPPAQKYLPQLLEWSQKWTWLRFGKTMHLFIPIYLSNECHNVCTYCGFSITNRHLPRITLTPPQMHLEARAVAKYGFQHVLLVTGEAWTVVNVPYLQQALDVMHDYFTHVSIEVQPMNTEHYETLRKHGLHAVVVYQETYDPIAYRKYHLKGRKARYEYRIETPDRIAQANIRKVGLGILVGLTDWRTDAWFLALHLAYMRNTYWRTYYSVAFPRLRPAEGFSRAPFPTTNRQYLQLISAFRLFDPDLDIVLSTREAPRFRDILFLSGITSTSAGSRTEPGAYALQKHTVEQFEVHDTRSPEEILKVLQKLGIRPVWKDWEPALV